MLKILLGTDWVSLRDQILGLVARDARLEQGGRVLIVPELISHDTERRLCAAAGDSVSRFAEVLSFTRLARRVAEQTGGTAVGCMDAGGRIVAMAAAVRQLHSRLKAYAAVETKPEFLAQMVAAVDELKRCRVGAGDLTEASRKLEGTLAQKLEELALILNAYDSLCAGGKRDPGDQMNVLLSQLADGDFAQRHVFYIDGFPDFSRQHMAILEHLIRVSPQVTVALNCDSTDSRQMAFEQSAQTARELLRCAQRAGVETQVHTAPAPELSLGDMCRSLFQGRLPENVPGVTVLRADSVHQEVTAAAERILALVREGSRYRDISVVLADMPGYRDAVRLIFRRCGIPVYLSGTEDILSKTVITSLLSAMEAALGGLEQREVLRYLRSLLSPLEPDESDLLENYARIWGISGNGWTQEWTRHPDGLNGIWKEETQQRLAALNRARETAITPLAKLRQAFRDGEDLARQLEGVYAFLEEIGLADRLSAEAQALEDAGDDRSAQILNQLWDILMDAMEQLYDVLGRERWEPEVFTRLFSLLLGQYDVGTIPPVLDAVTAGPVSAMRCQQAKHLFVLGACEGMLPGYGGTGGVLTEQERQTLRKLGVPLNGGSLEGLKTEFAEIYGVFCGARETVTVSYAGKEGSYLCRRLAEMSGGEGTASPKLGAALADPWEAGACLARLRQAAQARELGVEEGYRDVCRRADFTPGSIAPAHIPALYGEKLRLSASQVDQQAQCRMAYFLKYGLRAKECKKAEVDPAEFGSYVHAVLEHTARYVMAHGGFHTVSLEETQKIAADCARQYREEKFGELDSQRLTFLFRRNQRELEMVVEELWRELNRAEFLPVDFELAFGRAGKMPAIQIDSRYPAALDGKVDRVDVWQSEQKRYFRVVDYKTGKKDFDYCDIFNGVGLQMLLYLFALAREGGQIVGARSTPAGVQYFPARAPLVSAEGRLTPEQAQALREKEWKRKGLLLRDESALRAMDPDEDGGRLCCQWKKDGTLTGDLADEKQLTLLEGYVRQFLAELVAQIASGDVTPNPYTRGTAHDACRFCPFGTVCHKQDVSGRRDYQAMTAQRFWEEVARAQKDPK